MTAPRTSNVSTAAATDPSATPIARDAGTRLLKKIHATRPMLAERERRKNVAAIPAIYPDPKLIAARRSRRFSAMARC